MSGDVSRVQVAKVLPRGRSETGQPPARPARAGRHTVGNAAPQLRLTPSGPGRATARRVDDPALRGRSAKPAKPLFRLVASGKAKEAMNAAKQDVEKSERPRVYSGVDVRAFMKREPKKDVTLFGLAVKQRSIAYKGVVAKLDAYTNRVWDRDFRAASDPAARREQVRSLDEHLARAKASCDRYIAKHEGDADKKHQVFTMKHIRVTVEAERALLAGLDNGRDLPGDARFDRLLAKSHVGIPLEADVDTYSEANEKEGSRRVLGSGASNTAYVVEYINGQEKVYKKVVVTDDTEADTRVAARNVAASTLDEALGTGLIVKTDFASRGDELGIVMDRAAGKTPLTPVGRGRPLNKEQLAFVQDAEMRLANGELKQSKFKSLLIDNFIFVKKESGAYECRPSAATIVNRKDAQLIRSIMNLEWLDMINGEVDRNLGNYLISVSPDGKYKLTAIDNDACFSEKNVNINKPRGTQTGKPLLIDRRMAVDMVKMLQNWDKPDGMASCLKDLLTEGEVAAAKSRLTDLVEHIKALNSPPGAYVVDDWETWRSPRGETAAELLGSATTDQSYYAKLVAVAKDAEDRCQRPQAQ